MLCPLQPGKQIKKNASKGCPFLASRAAVCHTLWSLLPINYRPVTLCTGHFLSQFTPFIAVSSPHKKPLFRLALS